MKFYCLAGFKAEFEKLKRKKSYNNLEGLIISDICSASADTLVSARRLFPASGSPFIKKRLGGSGGYRIYYLTLIKQKKVCLAFVHPKTGSQGVPNITTKSKAELYKETVTSMKNGGEKFKVTTNKKKQTLEFEWLGN